VVVKRLRVWQTTRRVQVEWSVVVCHGDGREQWIGYGWPWPRIRIVYRDGVEYEAGSPRHESRLIMRDADKRRDRCRGWLSSHPTQQEQGALKPCWTDGTGTIAFPCSRCNCTTPRLALPSHSVIHSSTHPLTQSFPASHGMPSAMGGWKGVAAQRDEVIAQPAFQVVSSTQSHSHGRHNHT
jgi:hypothetical protein